MQSTEAVVAGLLDTGLVVTVNKERRTPLRSIKVLIGAIVVAIVVVALIVAFSLGEKLSPEQIAENWVADNVDAAGEEVAGFLLPQHTILVELGGEYIEDRIHDVLKWDYSPTRSLNNARYEVIATASIRFDVEIPLGSAYVEASLPFVLAIDHDAQVVDAWRVDPPGGRFSSNLPAVSDVIEAVGEAAERADAALEALESGDCIGAARKAGVPDRVIEMLEKPAEDRNFIERQAINTAIDAAGLSETCPNLTDQ